MKLSQQNTVWLTDRQKHMYNGFFPATNKYCMYIDVQKCNFYFIKDHIAIKKGSYRKKTKYNTKRYKYIHLKSLEKGGKVLAPDNLAQKRSVT